MRVWLRWLREYVADLPSPEEVARSLTMGGIEVEALVRPCGESRGVRVAQIASLNPHPSRSNLWVVDLEWGEGKTARVVSAATNLRVGMKVPYGPPGSSLADGSMLKVVDFGGIASEGMMLSDEELGLSGLQGERGILELPGDTPVGVDFLSWFGLDEPVLELSVTPNRGDCLSMVGVAREVYALCEGTSLSLPKLEDPPISEDGLGGLFEGCRVEDEGCSLYGLGYVDEVSIAPSPFWMRLRLTVGGARPINNAVDVTNYATLLFGQPLHAFDADLLPAKEITVRSGVPGERITAINGRTYELDRSDLVISSGGVAVAIAGVMGGKDTEVGPSTRRIALEAAVFSPSRVRRTARRLGISSEAAHRFSRGVDAGATLGVLSFALRLFAEVGAGRPFPSVIREDRRGGLTTSVRLRLKTLGEMIGLFDLEVASSKLARLGFKVSRVDEGIISAEVPSWRNDVSIEEDLVEEVGRTWGYERIPSTLPGRLRKSGELDLRTRTLRHVKDFMAARGYQEVICYSFVSPDFVGLLRLPPDDPRSRPFPLANPLSSEQSVMRTTMVPSLLEVVRRNVRAGVVDQLRAFEVGKVFLGDSPSDHREPEVLGGVCFVHRDFKVPFQPRLLEDFYSVKADLEALLVSMGIKGFRFEGGLEPFTHAGQTARLTLDGVELGYVGRLKPILEHELELPGALYLFELDLDRLMEACPSSVKYSQPPRFPASYRDVSLLVPKDVPSSAVKSAIERLAPSLVESVLLIDVYEGRPLPEDRRGLTFRLFYRASDRTLSAEEVDALHGSFREALAGEGFELR